MLIISRNRNILTYAILINEHIYLIHHKHTVSSYVQTLAYTETNNDKTYVNAYKRSNRCYITSLNVREFHTLNEKLALLKLRTNVLYRLSTCTI